MSFGATASNHGVAYWNGLASYESVEFTDHHGAQPGVGSMTIYPEYGLPAQDSDLVFSYNGNSIFIQNCHITEFSFQAGSGGRVARIQFVDERWTWKRSSISGRYNFRLPNNWVDPNHEQTPQQLATLLFAALGIGNCDVSALPNDSRPEVDWVCADAGQELERLCSDLGCRIVPIRSIGGWRICVAGEGNTLPTEPSESIAAGITPQLVPDFIKVVSAPVRFQVSLPLVAVGKEMDLSWKPIRQLSYAPAPSIPSAGFYRDPFDFSWLEAVSFVPPNSSDLIKGTARLALPDGTKISAAELAQDTIFKCWRVDFANQRSARQLGRNGDWFMALNGLPKPVCVQQIILTDKLVESYTDNLGVLHQRAAFVYGQFWGENADGIGNYPAGTRIDKQYSSSHQRMDERASFSLSLDPLDNLRSIITTSKPMVLAQFSTENFVPAKLNYCCAINVRDFYTWQPLRYEFMLPIGPGGNPNFCRVVVREDIQPWVIGTDESSQTRDNLREVYLQCQYYANSIAREYTAIASGSQNYIGLIPIDMDGAIQNVTWSIGPQGSSTQASRGTEHSWVTPSFEERRQQIARHGVAEKIQYAKYELARRESMKGTHNT